MSDQGKQDVESYLSKLQSPERETLQKVRESIRSIVPEATEGLSYGLPAFYLKKAIAGYGASQDHCSYYPMSGTVISGLEGELAGYSKSKGAVKFSKTKALPKKIIKQLLAARIAEIS